MQTKVEELITDSDIELALNQENIVKEQEVLVELIIKKWKEIKPEMDLESKQISEINFTFLMKKVGVWFLDKHLLVKNKAIFDNILTKQVDIPKLSCETEELFTKQVINYVLKLSSVMDLVNSVYFATKYE